MVSVKDLRSLRVLLVQPKNSEGAALRSHLMRIGCHVEEIWPPPSTFENIDIVFAMFDQIIEHKLTFEWQADDPPPVLIGVIDCENPLAIDRLLRIRANAVASGVDLMAICAWFQWNPSHHQKPNAA